MVSSWISTIASVLYLALTAHRVSCLGFGIGSPPSSRGSTTPTVNNEKALLILPSQVDLVEVSKQYPITLQRRLFSSVPYRECAVRNVSLVLNSECLYLLTGPSSSGKSCFLKLILGLEAPTSGCIRIATIAAEQPPSTGSRMIMPLAKPVYLDQREYMDSFRSVGAIVREHEKKCLPPGLPEPVGQSAVEELRRRLGLGTSRQWDCKPTDLSQSDTYCLGLLLASIESMFANSSGSCSKEEDDDGNCILPAPILLLDEWMDKETSGVIQTVQNRLEDLLQIGAVVCSVTHKADRWNLRSRVRQVNLRSGEVVGVLYDVKQEL